MGEKYIILILICSTSDVCGICHCMVGVELDVNTHKMPSFATLMECHVSMNEKVPTLVY